MASRMSLGALASTSPTSRALIEDQKTSGTAGGNANAASTWFTRDLNTEVFDPDGIVSIASNQITLLAGTYLVRARASMYATNHHRLRLRNITDSVTLGLGMNAHAIGVETDTVSTLICKFTLVAAKAIELQHWKDDATSHASALGTPASIASINEVYAQVEIERLF